MRSPIAALESMTIQTNSQMFTRSLPVHTVMHIGRAAGIVTLSGSDGSFEVQNDRE
jgi:hypothetical protein